LTIFVKNCNFKKPNGNENWLSKMKTKKMKILGNRSGKINPSWQEANRWLNTIKELRQGKGICPRGVYRFRTFEEADEWMTQMLIKSFHGTQP